VTSTNPESSLPQRTEERRLPRDLHWRPTANRRKSSESWSLTTSTCAAAVRPSDWEIRSAVPDRRCSRRPARLRRADETARRRTDVQRRRPVSSRRPSTATRRTPDRSPPRRHPGGLSRRQTPRRPRRRPSRDCSSTTTTKIATK